MTTISNPPEKPQLIFDGDCGFCRRWIRRWKSFTGSKVEYEISEKVITLYPEIGGNKFDRAVQLIETDGKVYEGAEAVFRTLSYAPGKSWLYKLYQKTPVFQKVSEWFYAKVAHNRIFFSQLTKWVWGKNLSPSTFKFSTWLFIKFIGLIYFFAFFSFASQILGLIGSDGILPLKQYLNSAYQTWGPLAIIQIPTLFWINASNFSLLLVCWSGIIISTCVVSGIFPAINLAVLWVLYLSLVNAGQNFMAFQWDGLLLEAGFLSIFLASWRKGGRKDPVFAGYQAPASVRYLLYFLLFRLMFFSGIMKLRGGDPSWTHLTALTFHYETQPLPTWAAWYFHQLPIWFHKFSAFLVLGIEIIVPFLFFFPRRIKYFSALSIGALQLLILLTGNYCFFNLLTLALCILLIDDQTWPHPWLYLFHRAEHKPLSPYTWPKWVRTSVLSLVLLGTFDQVPKIFNISVPVLSSVRNFLRPLRTFNQYGLFTMMTTERPEIIIEGSNNRVTWTPYEFNYKPGKTMHRPGFVLPHQPRLDWQMWFAALGSVDQNPWFVQFCEKLLKGSPDVVKMLKDNPFKAEPPRFIQATLYDYRFADPETRKKTGEWWVRERRSLYAPVISLRSRS